LRLSRKHALLVGHSLKQFDGFIFFACGSLGFGILQLLVERALACLHFGVEHLLYSLHLQLAIFVLDFGDRSAVRRSDYRNWQLRLSDEFLGVGNLGVSQLHRDALRGVKRKCARHAQAGSLQLVSRSWEPVKDESLRRWRLGIANLPGYRVSFRGRTTTAAASSTHTTAATTAATATSGPRRRNCKECD